MAYMQWHIVTSAEYAAGSKVDGDLYFLSDTYEIYRGSSSFTQAVGMYTDTLPTSPALNRIYFNTTNMEGKVYNGSTWQTVIHPIVNTVDEDGSDPVTGAAIAAYVASKLEEGVTSATVISDVAFDSAAHKLTITKGDESTKEITLTGLGVSLTSSSSGSTNSIQLVDSEGTPIGDPVELDVDRFVTGAEYDTESQSIIMYFDGKTGEESTDKITIPVGDLVDVYTVEDTATVNLEMVANKITAAVKVSAEEGNALIQKDDGLFVAPVDTSDLIPAIPGATAGNIPVLDENGMLTDSGKSFEDAGKPSIYTGTSIEAAVGEAIPKEGDFCIVTESIGTDTSVEEHTAYIYTNSAWVAMSGNYSAENVYFPDDLTATANIGVVKVGSNGQATISAKGKNLVDVMKTIMVEKKNPTATAPSVTVSNPKAASYEVGAMVTPSYSATLNPGSYTFGPATGIVASSWEISDTAGNTATTASGSFAEMQVTDGFNYRVTAKANYEASTAVPVTNTGEAYPSVQIAAGNKTGYSDYITGYRPFFYGSLTSKTAEIDSALVRSLTKSTKAAANNTYFEIPVVDQAMRIVFAYPQSVADAGLIVKDANGMDANITTSYTCHTINVEGANGYDAIPYKVYVSDKGEPVSSNTHKVTIKNS